MIHNNKVYANADEKFVKGTIIYADTNKTLYHDAEFTNPILTTELEDIFLNGAVIRITNGYQTPVFYKISSDGATYLNTNTTEGYKGTAPTEE